jgi:hypothetical protein
MRWLLLGVALGVLHASRVTADAPAAPQLAGAWPLTPSAQELAEREAQRTEARIEALLGALSSVRAARLTLSPVDVSRLPFDAQLPVRKATLLLEAMPGAPDDAALRNLITSSAPGVETSAISIVRTNAREPANGPKLVSLGPLRVAPESLTPLRLLLGVLLATNVLLATIVLRHRARRTA